MTEGMGYICDRTEEHLGSSDLAIIAMRRILEKRAADLQRGVEPAAARLHQRLGARPLDVLAPDDNLGALLARHADDVRIAAAAR
jgi:hypothetical protein